MTTVRNAKAEELQSLAALYDAQAQSALLVAEAQAALANSEAELNQAKLDSLKAELEVRLEELKTKMLEAQVAYAQKAATLDQDLYLAYLDAYTEAAGTLYQAQTTLFGLQVDLAQANSQLVTVEQAYATLVTTNTQNIADYKAQIARLQAQIDTYEDFAGVSAEELQDSLNNAKLALVEATTTANALSQEVSNAYSVLTQNDPWNSVYYDAVQAFLNKEYVYDNTHYFSDGTENPEYNPNGVIKQSTIDGVNYYGYYTKDESGNDDEFVPMFMTPQQKTVFVSNSATMDPQPGPETNESGAVTGPEPSNYTFSYTNYTSFYAAQDGLATFISDKVYGNGVADLAGLEATYNQTQAWLTEINAQSADAAEVAESTASAFSTSESNLNTLLNTLDNALYAETGNGRNQLSDYSYLTTYLETVADAYEANGQAAADTLWYTYLVNTLPNGTELDAARSALASAKGTFQSTLPDTTTYKNQINSYIQGVTTYISALEKNEASKKAWDAVVKALGNVTTGGTYINAYVVNADAQGNYGQTQNILKKSGTYSQFTNIQQQAANASNAYFGALNGNDPIGDQLTAAYNTITSQATSLATMLTNYNSQGENYANLQVEEAVANEAMNIASGTVTALANLISSNGGLYGSNSDMSIEGLEAKIAQLENNIADAQYEIDNFYYNGGLYLNGKQITYNSIEFTKAYIQWLNDKIEMQEQAVEAYEAIAKKALENLENYVENMGSDDNSGSTGGTTGGTTEGDGTDGGTTEGGDAE